MALITIRRLRVTRAEVDALKVELVLKVEVVVNNDASSVCFGNEGKKTFRKNRLRTRFS